MSEILPRLWALGWSGMIYSAANQARRRSVSRFATAYTGIGIYNPPGSGSQSRAAEGEIRLSVAPAAIATIGLLGCWAATGAVTAQTAKLTPQNGIIGNTAAGQGIALSQATIVTPTWIEQLYDGFTAAALPAPTLPLYIDGHLGVALAAFSASVP